MTRSNKLRHCERSEAIQTISADAVWIASSLRSSQWRLLPRHLRVADALAVEHLVVVHLHGDLEQFSRELERRVVMRHRAAAVAPYIEPRPGDQRVEAELRLQ